MNKVHFDQLDETLYQEQLPNGLEVYILPKKGFSKTFATFTTKYGSIDNHFVPFGGQEPVKVPDGIAHFLEHKMFEKEDGDVFQQFSKQGASANAFTSFTRTAYLFSATDQITENVGTLLDFVQSPYFTEKTVEKEKGIIAQEITMYDDQPDWRLYFGMIENLYKNHPVKIDIAGTVDSIQEITAEHLYTCYNTFYHPSNMVLFVVGAVEPESMMDFIRTNQSQKTFEEPKEIKRIYPEEPIEAAIKERTLEMSVQKPKVFVGIKPEVLNLSGTPMLKHELASQLAFELLFGRTSDFYHRAYENGWIDESYSFDYSLENGFGYALIGSDTSEPEVLAKEIQHTLDAAIEKWPFGQADLDRVRRKKIGFFLRALNSPEYIANQFTRYTFNQMNLFDVVPFLEALEVPDLQAAFATASLDSQRSVFTIVPPKKETV
ncbi:pitrilysin family protein [Planococcus shenhongbingii]|uniref:Pitrilysin family protein n=1 Tax=Planococcus shenhongbingii TaxID=3058398 RepID=A0ABT8N915_9BACL|nr:MULTISPECIES: pitrilysin family protein [unclassified Planococcus (in: firmicutes)]MDN7244162.1 pitrilysin family protein [Planococcus sp. N017]WKA57338.1 pitrilysin family protein [Planococcus sp. N016]